MVSFLINKVRLNSVIAKISSDINNAPATNGTSIIPGGWPPAGIRVIVVIRDIAMQINAVYLNITSVI